MKAGLERWHAAVKSGRPEDVPPLLAEDAVFESPIMFRPNEGKALTAMYLQGALHVLNNGHFRYLNEWRGEDSAILEFETVLDGVSVNGIDMIWWNAEGLISRFKVMIRPLKAVNMVHQKMGAMLESMKAG